MSFFKSRAAGSESLGHERLSQIGGTERRFARSEVKERGKWHEIMLEVVVAVKVAQSFPTLCDPMDYNPPGNSVHGIFQTRILKWVAMPFSRGASQSRD